jgi:glycerol-3-phosphate acyltransferase PlsX
VKEVDILRIAVDAMGGDHAPGEIVKGAVEAAKKGLYRIVLVGRQDLLERELARYSPVDSIEIAHAPEMVTMDEQPALALRRKRGTSIAVATELVKNRKADALVSAGSTGAQMAAALLILGRVKGIYRPAIMTLFPTLKKPTVLLDVGANTDTEPVNLYQFALMGSIYARQILKRVNPSVGLLNIGTEATKGNSLTKETFQVLSGADINFYGNVEARDLPQGVVDVAVCDGFVGNMVIKLAEGLAGTIFQMVKEEIRQSWRAKMGAALLVPTLKGLVRKMDYAEYGGAPLLGVKGVSIICHGSSKARAIENAIQLAAQCAENHFVEQIEKNIQDMDKGDISHEGRED